MCGVQQSKLSSPNRDFDLLTLLGCLSSPKVELRVVVKYAMTMCGLLDQQYLWADALCIIQDDEQDKLNQIRNMDQIYDSANLTVASAAGDDANAGLPGPHPGSRSGQQNTTRIGDLTLITCLPQYHATLESCRWTKRA
jgi:hypothetical protein